MPKLWCKLTLIAVATLMALPSALAQDIEIVRGERYGVSPAHRLNLFIPSQQTEEARPLLTIMGGSNQSELDAWDQIASRFAQRGYAVVVAGYRHIDQLQWPQGPDEMRDIAGWVRASLSRLGAARAGMMMDQINGMFVLAPDMAANHVAAYAFNPPSHMGRGASGMEAAVLINTSMLGTSSDNHAAYFKHDQSLAATGQPASLAASYSDSAMPRILMLDAGDMDDAQNSHNQLLRQAICDHQPVCPDRIRSAGTPAELLARLQSVDDETVEILFAFFEETAP